MIMIIDLIETVSTTNCES